MREGMGQVRQIFLNAAGSARIACPPALVPAAGQYLLALSDAEPDAPLATPVFPAGPAVDGFLAAGPLPASWLPGTSLSLRGPLGRGFDLPRSARRVTLLAHGQSPARLAALLAPAAAQGAAVTLICDRAPEDIPAEIEIAPPGAMREAAAWADFLAIDAAREALPELLASIRETRLGADVQLLVRTPLTCGGLADCAACAVQVSAGFQLACRDGPVFKLSDLVRKT